MTEVKFQYVSIYVSGENLYIEPRKMSAYEGKHIF